MPAPRPIPPDFTELRCRDCARGGDLGFDFGMALQPIVRLSTREVFAHEALVRGPAGEPAAEVFRHVHAGNRYRFDQTCRVKAIETAARLELPGLLSINFMPNAVYRAELCIRTTLEAARAFGFPVDRILFEVTEAERVEDMEHLRAIIDHYQRQGFLTALDDFGAGYAGLNMLADFQTDIVKIDMGLIRQIDRHRGRQAIVRGITQACDELGIRVIAEGVESREELDVLRGYGIDLFQGYLFARPAHEALPEVAFPD